MSIILYFIFIYVILNYTKSFCRHKISNCLSRSEYVITINLFFMLATFCYFIYRKYFKKDTFDIFNKLKTNKRVVLFLLILTFSGIFVTDAVVKNVKDDKLTFHKSVPLFLGIAYIIVWFLNKYVFKI